LEVELAQISLYEFHVNDDDATTMVQTEYNEDDFDSEGNFIPTVFYKPSDEKHSLLHRLLADKAPHWSIGYVTPYIALDEESQPETVGTFQRTYTSDGTSIYDLLTGDIAEESNVIFIFDTMNRQINCYSLCDCIDQSTGNIMCSGIGEDTNILLSKNKLANEISISSNKDEVKNCFRVEGGDDTITAMVAAVNMNGSNYIYQFADFQYNDMSEDLSSAIKSYQNIMSDESIQNEYYGENGIYTKLCEKYDELAYYQSSMMPSVELEDTTAEEQYNNIVSELKSMTIGVSSMSNYDNKYFTAVTNNVIAIAEVLLDSRYEIEVIDGTTSFTLSSDKTYGTWKGNILITRTSDETEYYPRTDDEKNQTFNVTVNDDELTYEKQKIQKALAKADMTEVDFNVAEMSDDEIRDYFDLYSLSRLDAFAEGYNTCLSTLMSIDDSSDVKKELYSQYQNYYSIVTEIQEKRQAQVDSINDEIDALSKEQKAFQEKYDFQTFLNNLDVANNLEEGSLYKEFCAYRREDSYKNDNYISDGLSTSECLAKAKELVEVATKEAKKACVLQRTISTNLNNLFALPEFEPFYDKFALFNYIRVRTDDEILKLRLIGVDFSGDSIESINVTFSEQIESVDGTTSDLTSLLQQASSMATSYSSTTLQAKKGDAAHSTFDDLYNNGLNTANIMLTNNTDQEVTLTTAGLICRKQMDEGYYSPKQFRLCNNILGFTTDNWKSTSAAFGELLYTDPITGEKSWKYGVLAPALIGELIVGKQMYIGNKNGNVQITGDGITITNGVIQSANYSETDKTGSILDLTDGSFSFAGEKIKWDKTNLSIIGNISATSGSLGNWYINNNRICSSKSISIGSKEAGLLLINESDKPFIHAQNSSGTTMFTIDRTGKLKSTDADISGKITATSGTIGGWNISDLKIYSGDTDTGVAVMQKPTSGTTYVFAAGGTSHTSYDDCPFRVTKKGQLTATNCNIEGTIKATTIKAYKAYYIYDDDLEEDVKIITRSLDDSSDSNYKFGRLSDNGYNSPLNYIGFKDMSQERSCYVRSDKFSTDCNIEAGGNIYSTGKIESKGNIEAGGNIYSNQKYYANDISILEYGIDDDKKTRCRVGDKNLNYCVLRGETVTHYNSSGYTTLSDERLKNSFESLDNFDDVFMGLQAIRFKYNNGTSGRYHFGFKAQDVKEALENNGYTTQDFGGFVQMSDSTDDEDYCGIDDPMGLIYTEFTSWNTHMIQKLYKKVDEQQVTIEQQQTEIDTLKEQVSFLLSKIS
jgi:hypothetical protein